MPTAAGPSASTRQSSTKVCPGPRAGPAGNSSTAREESCTIWDTTGGMRHPGNPGECCASEGVPTCWAPWGSRRPSSARAARFSARGVLLFLGTASPATLAPAMLPIQRCETVACGYRVCPAVFKRHGRV
eukprot:1194639-Prorocentrum_minimum.AAC.3